MQINIRTIFYLPLTAINLVISVLAHMFSNVWSLWSRPLKVINGEILLITGGGSGIGRSLAIAFARHNPAHIILWGRNIHGLQSTKSVIQQMGVQCSYFQCDVSSREDIFQKAAEVKKHIGDVTILINNAGVVKGKPLKDLELEEMEYVLHVNTLAHIWTVKAFLPAMIDKQTGHIVCMSSILGQLGFRGTGDYSTSKFAVIGFMESLALELLPYPDIHTTIIQPYKIDNAMFAGMVVRFSRLFPPLREDGLVKDIIHAVLTNQKYLTVPWYFHMVMFFRSVLPVSAMIETQRFFGLHRTMDQFHANQS